MAIDLGHGRPWPAAEDMDVEALSCLSAGEGWCAIMSSRFVSLSYPLVTSHSYGNWSIEIDGLPNLKIGGFSMAMLKNQGVSHGGTPKATIFIKEFP